MLKLQTVEQIVFTSVLLQFCSGRDRLIDLTMERPSHENLGSRFVRLSGLRV